MHPSIYILYYYNSLLCQFLQHLNTYLLGVYVVPDAMLSGEDNEVNKA